MEGSGSPDEKAVHSEAETPARPGESRPLPGSSPGSTCTALSEGQRRLQWCRALGEQPRETTDR